MAGYETFRIGAEVSCSDGNCGELRRVVVDPVAKAVTHLVVEPKHRLGIGRLVPVDSIETAGEEIRLRCDLNRFKEFELAEETQFLPGTGRYPGYDETEMMAWPYYSLGTMGLGSPSSAADGPHVVASESVPPGEVDVGRGERVEASDGEIGRVQGLVMDPATRHVTHVLLQEGHLWGRKQVAIPIKSIQAMDDGVAVRLTKEEIADLPPVSIEDFETEPPSR